MGRLINPGDLYDIIEGRLKGMVDFEPIIKPGEIKAVMPFMPKWVVIILVSVMSLVGIMIPPFIAKEITMLKSSVRSEEHIKVMKDAILRIELKQIKIEENQKTESAFTREVFEKHDERLDDLESE